MSGNSEWQPIETAPKDGERVLLLCDWEPLHIVGYWGIDRERPNSDECWRVAWDESEFEPGYEATHWMPLPDPPLPMPA